MTILKGGYQTTIGSSFITKHIEEGLEESIIRNGDFPTLNVKSDDVIKPGFVVSESPIPLFTHPILVNTHDKRYLITDMRLYVRHPSGIDIGNIEASIKNLTEYNFCKCRSILNLIWLNNGVDEIKSRTSFASSVFSHWLSQSVARIYGLDYKDQLTLTVITNFYYQTLFTDKIKLDEEDRQKMATHTIKATKAPADFVFKVFDRIESMGGIEDYCATVKKLLENSRLDNFNLGVLLTIIKNSWYGVNAKEIISVGLEHPPTWVAILYACLTERTWNSTAIYKAAESVGKSGGIDEFMNGVKDLVQSELVNRTTGS